MGKIILIHGGWEGHEPRACVERFVPYLKRAGHDVVLSDSLEPCGDQAYLESHDLIVLCWTMGALTEYQERGLCGAVASGVGLAGWHGGLCDAFRGNCTYNWMTGGQFVAHPGDIFDYTVDIVRPEDPIVEGLQSFSVRSEQYYMLVDPSNEVLATTTFSGDHADWVAGCVMPVVWKRKWHKGRVFYSALGHQASEFDVYETRTIMERGMRWACRTA